MCYQSLVGLKGCDRTEPTTGLYIDDLGINTTLLGQFITDQYVKGEQLFDDKLRFAWSKLSSDILNRLAPSMRGDTLIEDKRVGLLEKDFTRVQTSTGSYAGIRLTINPNDSYIEFYLAELTLSVPAATTDTPILIIDLQTGKLIETITYATGGVDQVIGKALQGKKRPMDIAIVWEFTQDVSKTIPKKGHCFDCSGNVRVAHICPFVDAIGVTLDWNGTTVSNVANSKYTAGLSIAYNVNCDRKAWLCSIGNLMAMPLAYATAVEIYNYALTVSPSQRVNTAVVINRGTKDIEGMTTARDMAAEQYDIELKSMLENMRLPNDRNCFNCRNNLKYVTALP